MSSSAQLLRNLAINLAIVCSLACSATAMAQSGRRAPKSKPVAVSIPEPEPEPTPTTSAETAKPAIRVVLGMDKYDSFSSVSLSTTSSVQRNCAHRLEEPQWIKVDNLQRALTRGEAVKRAKSEKDSYVVWLRIREDTMSGNQPGTANNAYIEYAVFAPGTAKVITSGGVYPRRGNGKVILGPTTSGIDGDYYLNKAARETADRIASKLSQRLPQPGNTSLR